MTRPVLRIARQPCYRWLTNPATDDKLSVVIARLPCSTTASIPISATGSSSRRPALADGLVTRKRARGDAKTPGPPVQDDPRAVLTRCDGPARVHRRGRARLLAGVTERRRAADTLYACAIKDVYSHRIVGNSIDSRLRSRIAGSAQNHAVARRTQSLADRVLYIDQVSRAASWPELVHALNRDPWWAR